MAYKIDVAKKHFELAVTRKVTPVESNLLRFLELGTIGAQNKRSQICSKAEFWIDDISKAMGYKTKMKIWAVLRSLEKKGYIVRQKTRSVGKEILGLNPKVFSQILTDRHHAQERGRHLSLVPKEDPDPEISPESFVDNSANDSCSEQTDRMSETNDSFADNKQIVCSEQTDRLRFESQDHEIIDENHPLYSSRCIYMSSIGQNQGDTNVSTGEGEDVTQGPYVTPCVTHKRSPEEQARAIREQLEMLKAGKI